MKFSFLKKRLSLIGLIVCFANICFAQLGQMVNGGSTYSPPSPNASALLKYANVPIDEHTGIASVVLPIDQLAGRQLSAPITLSYHGAGNKVQDIASNVGLGFVLNAGGVITRVMRGLPDESSVGYQYNGKKVYSRNVDSAYLNATINNKIDGEPDMFYFNFLGHSGKFVVDTLGHSQYMPDQGMRVIRHPIHNSADSTQNAWVLKDFSGTTYIFGIDTLSRELTYVNLAGHSITDAKTYISSWHLSKIITADGKETMTFSYSSGPNMSYTQYRNITTYNIYHDCVDTRTGIFSSHVRHEETVSTKNVVTDTVNTIIKVLSPKYLTSIQNDMGSVTISYTSRLDVSGGQAVNQIKIYTVNDNATPLKTYTFTEGYFLSPSPNSPTDPDSKRLRLDCVTLQGRSAEIKQLYSFSYNQQTLLPPRNSNEFDHWGYYTNLDNRAGFPPANLTVDEYGNYDDGFDGRAADSTRVQACMLTRIRNLNGGYTNFVYETNRYKFNGKIEFGGGLRIRTVIENDSLGQVMPVTKQYQYLLDDGTSSGMIFNAKPYYIQGITNYEAGTVVQPIPSLLEYELNNLKKPLTIVSTAASVALYAIGLTSPVGLAINIGVTILAPAFADAYQFLFHRTHHYDYDSPPFAYSSAPLNNLFDINGASVTYSQVEVINTDGGKKIDYYTSQQEYADSTSSFVLNLLAQPVKTIYGNAGSYAPATSFSFARGLLKKSMLFDSNNRLQSTVINTYKLSNRVAAVAGQRSSVSGYATVSGALQVITYNVGLYNEIAENIQLVKSTSQLYDQTNNGNSITTYHTYTWQPSYPTLLHSESTPRSDGLLLTNYISYPMEYASGTTFLDNMVSHHILGAPIEKISTLWIPATETPFDPEIIGGVINRYKTGGLGLLDTTFTINTANPILYSDFKFSNHLGGAMDSGPYQVYKMDNSYTAKAFYQAYNSKNDLVQSQNLGEPSSSTIWGYNQNVPIAKVTNATIDKVAYTSFETNDQQYWSFTAGGRDSSSLGKTGKIRYQLSSGSVSTHNSLPAGTYILSLWTQGSKPTISGTTADVSIVNGESDNNSWNYYMDRVTVGSGGTITLSGSGYIDEVRLYPQGAHMSTITVTPQVGTSSVNSPDDKVNTYEYDALLRILNERDDQYNILKNYTYANVAALACGTTPDVWVGINPTCYSDQTNITPNKANYKAIATNSYGNIICSFSRTVADYDYIAKVNFTVSFSDNTTYTTSTILKRKNFTALFGLPLTGKSAESVSAIAIDSVINLSDDYGQTYQSFANRQRVRDSYVEANTLYGGLGIYIAPIKSSTGCSNLFSNKAQTGFAKNNCTTGVGSIVTYTVAAGLYTATSQNKADSIARTYGQAYANTNGNCAVVDTTFMGIDPYCITSTADSGTPTLSAYSASINYEQGLYSLSMLLSRSSGEAVHDATVSYTIKFNDGSSGTYTTPMYKDQLSINISPPLGGYGPNSVIAVSINSVTYTALNRRAYTNRKRYLNGVADGYQETNSAGTYYLAPVADPGACGGWFYNTAQTGFFKNDCSTGPGSSVSYTVAAHTDSSTVSQSYADAMARIRGQAYANAHGNCLVGDTIVTTIAGNGHVGYVNGNGSSAEFTNIGNITSDSNSYLYLSDGSYSSYLRKIDPNKLISTLAGSPSYGYKDSVGVSAKFNGIRGIVTDVLGNIYVCDDFNYKIRKISPTGVVTTLAGSTSGYVNGQGTAAKFGTLMGLGIDPMGNLYAADNTNNRIRQITVGGAVTTFAGNGTSGYVDGPLSTAAFSSVEAVVVDKSGIVYVSDHGRIRKIVNGIVSTLAGDGTYGGFSDGIGSAAEFGYITQMVTDNFGNIYLSDSENSCVRKVTSAGVVTTITMYGIGGYEDGSISSALFSIPWGIAIDIAGDLYISDAGNNVIRKITFPKP
jgi:hypothetical protein